MPNAQLKEALKERLQELEAQIRQLADELEKGGGAVKTKKGGASGCVRRRQRAAVIAAESQAPKKNDNSICKRIRRCMCSYLLCIEDDSSCMEPVLLPDSCNGRGAHQNCYL